MKEFILVKNPSAVPSVQNCLDMKVALRDMKKLILVKVPTAVPSVQRPLPRLVP
jgi:hypothetical protein